MVNICCLKKHVYNLYVHVNLSGLLNLATQPGTGPAELPSADPRRLGTKEQGRWSLENAFIFFTT